MNIRLCSLLIIVLAGLSNATAWAQSIVERFDRIDRNRDGKVTREEAASAPWFDQLLRRFDRNRNGVLERNEIAGTGLRRSTSGTGDLKMPEEPAHTKHLNIRYAEIEGVDPNLLSLDLYVPKTDSTVTRRPVLIMIHGGGWRRGDKAGPSIVGCQDAPFRWAGIHLRQHQLPALA